MNLNQAGACAARLRGRMSIRCELEAFAQLHWVEVPGKGRAASKDESRKHEENGNGAQVHYPLNA
jgi:hypothetical protein